MSQSQTEAPGISPGSASGSTARKDGLPPAGEALILLWAALVAYWPAVRGGLVMDDLQHLTTPALSSLHGLWEIWFRLGATTQYYPLLHSAFWLEYRLWDGALIGYHLLNVVLHGLSAYLVVRIVRRLGLPGALLAGFVFALHPVCVESVAWISEQKSTLSGVFYLGSALTYLHFSETRRRWEYCVALALFVLALLSKSVTATLPAALLVIFWWRKGRLDWKRDVRPLAGWLVLGACSGLFTAWVERVYIHAQGPEFALSPLERLLLAGRVVWFYAGKAVWPVNLMFNYPRWIIDPGQWQQYLYPAGLVVLAAGLCLLARRSRGPLAAFLIFVGTLVPVLGFLNVYPFRYSYVADHYQYLASLALIVPLSSLLAMAAQRLALPRQAAGALAMLLVLVLAVSTWRQAHWYADAEVLYRETLARNPASILARVNLCQALLDKPGRLEDAVAPCEESLRLRPDLAETHLNVGLVWAQVPGRMPEAIAEIQAALRIRPAFAEAHFGLGNALRFSGRPEDAIAEYQAALRYVPDYPQAYVEIGNALLAIPGRQQDALAAFEDALRLQPCDAAAHYGLGNALLRMPGRGVDALAEFDAALQCRPDYTPALNMLRQLEHVQ